MLLDTADSGEYRLDDGALYKGDTNLSEDSSVISQWAASTSLKAVVYVGSQSYTAGVSDGLSGEASSATASGGYYFSNSVNVSGESCYGVYRTLGQTSDGQNVVIFTGIPVSQIDTIYVHRVRSTVLLMIAIAVVCAIVCLLVVTSIVKRLQASLSDLNKVADGSLDFAVDSRLLGRKDEVGVIAAAIQELVNKFTVIAGNLNESSGTLNHFTEDIKESFSSINESIGNVNIAMDELAVAASSQANETTNVTHQMNDMSSAIDSAARNIEQLTESTQTMAESNRVMDQTLEELVSISKNTGESIRRVHEQTLDTNKSAEEIQNVVKLISDITSQTNLLSLNASIEAARAGEQGRGFAVVADEVRELADQSRESAQQIANIISELIDKSNDNVDAMANVVEEINLQQEKLISTRKVFGELNDEIVNVTKAVESIRDIVDTIDHSKDAVYSNMENLAAISEENAASTQETSATMNQLKAILESCNEALGVLNGLSENLTSSAQQFRL
jgi:methyl-accepting chemotaxis protein